MASQFPILFHPFNLGQLELKNRIVMPPMGTNYASKEGTVTGQLKEYYAARAHGGVGLVIVEATCVEGLGGKGIRRQLLIDDDRCVPGLRELVQEIKQKGAKAAIQLHHAGSEGKLSLLGVQPVAPSPISKRDGDLPRELSIKEVDELVVRFAKAAKRAKEAGFDGVEIHGAHSYLIAQFLSSFFNRRGDAYGGGIEGRAKFLIEIIRATRELLGSDYPIWCRINGREFGAEAGLTSEEAQQVARMAQDAGASAVHVSVYAYGVSPRTAPPNAQPFGNWLRFAEAVKKSVSIPVIAVGRIDPPTAEKAIQEERADLIAIGRALIADPELPNKAASGSLNEIRPCIGCLTCFDCVAILQEPLRCVVNPTVGKERESVIRRSDRPKKVIIIGGGPSGMEAARVSALRGNNVMLYERGRRLGGQLLVASVPPHKEILETFAEYQRNQLLKLGVKVELGRTVSAPLVKETNPDVAIIATGVRPFVPQIPGIDRSNVVRAVDVLTGKAEVGQKIVFIGGELVACETAEFLADLGKIVTLTEMAEDVATKTNPSVRKHLLARLAVKGITILTGVRYQEITDQGVIIKTKEGKIHNIEASTIILAAGSIPEDELYHELEGKVPELCRVGDCVEPRNIISAVADGFFTALLL